MELPENVQRLRRKAQTDLFWLADLLFKSRFGGDSLITERTHRPLADMFVQKDPDKSIADQDVIKDRLILYPRTSYKSSWDIIDVVQWIICFPDIRILILTGLDSLATAFVDELQNYFVIDGESTDFQKLFPEFCIKPKERRENGEFYCPARKRYSKEPTVFASSIESNNSGWHVDVMKSDDVLTDANTDTIDRIEKITRKFYMIRKLLMSYGYLDVIGTRYGLTDTYGDIMEKNGIQTLYGQITIPGEIKYLNIPAWWKKGTNYEIPGINEDPKEEDLELLFPEGIPYKYLRKELKRDRSSFFSQYLNDPVGASEVTFTREELIAATIPYTQVPQKGKYFIAWDLAYSARAGRDYTVGAVGFIDDQARLFVIDVIRGRYQPHELPYMIAKAVKDWNPSQSAVEDIRGAQWLKPEIERWTNQMGVKANIDWFPPDTSTNNAKALRIESLKPLLTSGRLFFSSTIGCLEDLIREFTRFTPEGNKRQHDDIPDAISFLKRFVPRMMLPQELQTEVWADLKAKDAYDRIYNQGQYAYVEPTEEPVEEDSTLFDPYTGLPA